MFDVNALLEQAEGARPERRSAAPGRKWARLFPVFSKLRSQNFSGPAAVAWLISKGAVTKDEEERALKGLQQQFWRHSRQSEGNPQSL